MTDQFAGRVALVTGAASGLGKSHALDLARQGAHVVVNDRARTPEGESQAQRYATELTGMGLSASWNATDVSVEAEIRQVVDDIVAQFGKIDIVVNNAGNGIAGSMQDTSTADFQAHINVHLLGMFWVMQQAVLHMRKQGYGRVVNTGSGLGAFGLSGSFAYATVKAAIHGMTRAAALDNADRDIRINAISPIAYTGMADGFTAIASHLTEDRLNVSRVSPVVLMLCSEQCPINGEVISAGGGRAARIFTATMDGYSSETLSCEDLLANLDQVMAGGDPHILSSSREQYALIPRG